MVDSDPTIAMTVPAPRSRGLTHLPRNAGFVLGIVGAAVYMMGSALPYLRTMNAGPDSSLVSVILHSASRVGGVGFLSEMVGYFGIAVIAVVVCVSALRAQRREGWAFALLGASSVAFLRIVVELLAFARSGYDSGWLGPRVMDLGVTCMFAGGVIAAVSCRSPAPDPASDVGSGSGSDPGSGRVVGFTLALTAALGFVGASFLPYYKLSPSMFGGTALTFPAGFPRSVTLAHGLLSSGVDGFIQGALRTYGAALLVVSLAALGVFRRSRERWAAALLGACAAWSAQVAITLQVYGRTGLAGFWVTRLAIVIALVGGVIAVRESWRSTPAALAPTGTP